MKKPHVAARAARSSNYYFADKLAEIRRMMAEGKDVINLGVGSPDLPPMNEILGEINRDMQEDDAFRYQPYQGSAGLVDGMGQYLRSAFGIAMDVRGIVPLMGSKEGCGFLSLAHLDPGDAALVPNPGYPTYSSATRLAGGVVCPYNLDEEGNFHPDVAALDVLTRRSADEGHPVRLIWLNYPHMPTGASPDAVRLQEVVDWARENGLLVVHDNPYARVLNAQPPFSIHQLNGSLDHCIELHSLSKSHRLSGARIGFAVGAPGLIGPMYKVSTQFASGSWRPLQKAAMMAMKAGEADIAQMNESLRKRRETGLRLLCELGCHVREAQTGLFLWARTPEAWDGNRLSDALLEQCHVFLTPGSVFGSQGLPFVRLSLCSTHGRLAEAHDRIRIASPLLS
ncbi:MAG: aminotransferase class I/II-fold pyridoxal phosphate-dependent enzyme [Flavobacteriales bacterium]|nr:aminotransferase class I/II-fold pyridoxal phosphate-dependent enzyme [Flavobacteriales bacterium]